MHCTVDNRPNETTPNEDKKITSKKSLDFAKFTAFEIFKHIISAKWRRYFRKHPVFSQRHLRLCWNAFFFREQWFERKPGTSLTAGQRGSSPWVPSYGNTRQRDLFSKQVSLWNRNWPSATKTPLSFAAFVQFLLESNAMGYILILVCWTSLKACSCSCSH